MGRLRLAAGALALLTFMIAALLWLNHVPDLAVLGGVAGAAGLSVVAPIAADRPARRHRVMWAAIFYAIAIGVATGTALAGGTRLSLVAPLGLLGSVGVVLAACASLVRNRRRSKAWGDYFDR